jgi:hypothetical protein
VYSGPPIYSPRGRRYILSTLSPEMVGVEAAAFTGGSAPGDQNYPVANLALYIPFTLTRPLLVKKLWVRNGSAVAGQLDMGIYQGTTRLVSIGGTNQAGIDLLQEFDITDTVIPAETRLYLAINSNTSGATQKVYAVTTATGALLGLAGCFQQAVGAVTLPSTATFATYAQIRLPLMGLAGRTLVV